MLVNFYWLSKLKKIFIFFLILPFGFINVIATEQIGTTLVVMDRVCSSCKIFRGSGRLSFFGINLYRAELYSEKTGEDFFKMKFALRIKYSRKFKGSNIAKRSIKEIKKLNFGSQDQQNQWYADLKAKLPNIEKDDYLTGIFKPNFGFEIYHNNVQIMESKDKQFAKAFFSIWLDKNTSEPILRGKLLSGQ